MNKKYKNYIYKIHLIINPIKRNVSIVKLKRELNDNKK